MDNGTQTFSKEDGEEEVREPEEDGGEQEADTESGVPGCGVTLPPQRYVDHDPRREDRSEEANDTEEWSNVLPCCPITDRSHPLCGVWVTAPALELVWIKKSPSGLTWPANEKGSP